MPVMAKPGKGDFKPCPPGVFTGVCVDVIDEGMKPGYQGKLKPKVRIVWQVNRLMDDNKSYYTVHGWYTNSMHVKSNLYPVVTTMLGREVEEDEIEAGFDLECLLGTNVLIQITHNTKDGKTYANISSIMALPPGMPPHEPVGYIRKVHRESEEEVNSTDPDADIPF